MVVQKTGREIRVRIRQKRLTTNHASVNGITWRIWWERFESLANYNDFPVGTKDAYFEYFEDGDSPEDALKLEMAREP